MHVCPVPKHQEMLPATYSTGDNSKQCAPCGSPLDRLLELGLCNATILRRGYKRNLDIFGISKAKATNHSV